MSCGSHREKEATEFEEGSQLHLLSVEDIGSIPKAMFDHDLHTVYAIVRKGKVNFSEVGDSLFFYDRVGDDTIVFSQGAWGVFHIDVKRFPMIETVSSGSCTKSSYKRKLVNPKKDFIIELRAYSDSPDQWDTINKYYIEDDLLVLTDDGYVKTHYLYSNDTLIQKTIINNLKHPLPEGTDSSIVLYNYSKEGLYLMEKVQFAMGQPFKSDRIFSNGIPEKEIYYHESSDSTIAELEYIAK